MPTEGDFMSETQLDFESDLLRSSNVKMSVLRLYKRGNVGRLEDPEFEYRQIQEMFFFSRTSSLVLRPNQPLFNE
jgi:hypothetical protein